MRREYSMAQYLCLERERVRECEGEKEKERVRERGREGVRKRKVDRCGILRAVAISKQRWECGSARL